VLTVPQTAPPRRRGPLLVAVAVVVVAAGIAVWGLLALVSANSDLDAATAAAAEADDRLAEVRADDDLAFTRARDEVLAAARHAVPVMNTLDHRTLDEDLAAWAEVTTGALHDEISNLSEDHKRTLRDAKAVTTGKVRSSAVTELDDRSGTATVLAAVEKTQTTGEGEPTVSYLRVRAELSRTDQGWKLSNLSTVAGAGR
jgi:Mce-associated membrane protein